MTVEELIKELEKYDKSLEVEITLYLKNGDVIGVLHDYITVMVNERGNPKRLHIFGEEDD